MKLHEKKHVNIPLSSVDALTMDMDGEAGCGEGA